MDFCGAFLGFLCFIFLVGKVLPAIIEWREEVEAARIKREAEEADARFQREHPEAWKAKEMVKLEKERLAAEKALAEERAKQENVRSNAGLIVKTGRILGWW